METYSLVIVPNRLVCRNLAIVKKRLSNLLGGFYHSVGAEGHISILYFMATRREFKVIEAAFRRAIASFHPFEVAYRDFSQFNVTDRNTFFVAIQQESAEKIKGYGDVLRKFVRMKRFRVSARFKFVYRQPHLTVARQISDEQLEKAHGSFKEFRFDELCRAFAFRRLNTSKNQYDVISRIPMLGRPNVMDGQLSLF